MVAPGHRARRGAPRSMLAVVVALGLLTGFVGVRLLTRPEVERPTRPASAPGAPSPSVAEPTALAVLRAWDEARARAYARSDPHLLATLYVSGSRTGAADLAVLAGYRARDLRVTSMRTRLIAADVLLRTPTRLRVRVTDVLDGALVRGSDGRSWPLPRDRPSTRIVRLRLDAAGWRVVEAYPAR